MYFMAAQAAPPIELVTSFTNARFDSLEDCYLISS